MRKMYLNVACAAMSAAVVMTGCGSTKSASSGGGATGGGSPFGAVYDVPCSVQDDDDNFAATGIASGSKNRMDVLQTNALTNAQNIVRQKMQHAYKGAIDDYSNSIGDNSGTDMTAKVERAGTQIINGIVNNTKAVCGPKFSSVDAKGDVNCYIAIRISNKQVIEAVANHLSNDKELKIRFDEENFRKKMEANFEKFKEQK